MKVEEYENEALQDLSMDKVDTESFRSYVVSLGFKRIKWGRYLFNEECITSVMEDKLKELNTELEKLNSESKDLEEKIAHNIKELLGV